MNEAQLRKILGEVIEEKLDKKLTEQMEKIYVSLEAMKNRLLHASNKEITKQVLNEIQKVNNHLDNLEQEQKRIYHNLITISESDYIKLDYKIDMLIRNEERLSKMDSRLEMLEKKTSL